VSICLSHRSTAATAASGFAAQHQCLQQILIVSCGCDAAGAGAQQQMQVASGRELTEEAQHRLIWICNVTLLVIEQLNIG